MKSKHHCQCDRVDAVICFGGLSSSFHFERSPAVVGARLWPGVGSKAPRCDVAVAHSQLCGRRVAALRCCYELFFSGSGFGLSENLRRVCGRGRPASKDWPWRSTPELVVRFKECGGAANLHPAPFISFPLFTSRLCSLFFPSSHQAAARLLN